MHGAVDPFIISTQSGDCDLALFVVAATCANAQDAEMQLRRHDREKDTAGHLVTSRALRTLQNHLPRGWQRSRRAT